MSKQKKISVKKEGFSLVELIIVVAIMSILVGLTALGFGFLRSADAKGVTHGINSGLSELKSENMAKNKKIYMHLSEYDGSYYITYTESDTFTPDGSGKDIGSSDVTVTCDGTVMAPGSSVCFSIRKKDGAFTHGPSKINVTADNGSSYDIYLVKDTGKHYIE